MPNVLVEDTTPETIEKFTIWRCVGRLEIESAGDCWSHSHITWLSGFDFEWSLGNEKAIRKMSATFAHNRPQMQSCDNFEGVFSTVQPQYGQVFVQFHNRGRQHTRYPTAVKTVISLGKSEPKKAKVSFQPLKSWQPFSAMHMV